jgi:enamine deaminase RidA (YjgF/YER057c/UK114 family)
MITRINPETLHHNPGFTQVATVSGLAKLVFVGGQNGVDIEGRVVGQDIASQSAQAYKNVIAALEAAGASIHDVFKMTIYIAQGQSIQDAYSAVMRIQPPNVPPPTVTVLVVAGLGRPECLIEIEAVAAIGEK